MHLASYSFRPKEHCFVLLYLWFQVIATFLQYKWTLYIEKMEYPGM
jgi:hypothetical protein